MGDGGPGLTLIPYFWLLINFLIMLKLGSQEVLCLILCLFPVGQDANDCKTFL